MNIPTSLAGLAEQLCRIEHKMDLILGSQAMQNPATSLALMNSQEHLCPVCLVNPTHQLDIFNGHVTRTCGCSTGKVPLNLNLASINAPGNTPSSNTPQGTDNDE